VKVVCRTLTGSFAFECKLRPVTGVRKRQGPSGEVFRRQINELYDTGCGVEENSGLRLGTSSDGMMFSGE
jgi:hypothetical protein